MSKGTIDIAELSAADLESALRNIVRMDNAAAWELRFTGPFNVTHSVPRGTVHARNDLPSTPAFRLPNHPWAIP